MKSKTMNRRQFLQTSAGLTAASLLSGCGKSVTRKKEIPVALQLYSVRGECAKDFPATIAAVAEMGYRGVEFAGYYDYPARDVRKMLDDNGLKCAGTHTALNTVQPDALEATIEYNQILGNRYLIVPWLSEEQRNTKAIWMQHCALFNELSETLKPHGMMIGYHSHDFDFKPVEGVIPWDLLAASTTDDVILQLDTANCASAGADPLAYLKKYPGRAITIHLKEHSAAKTDAMLGQGDIPFPAILRECRTNGGTEWFIIEEEKDAIPPMEAAKICHDNLMTLLELDMN